jgi:hypothetical protein
LPLRLAFLQQATIPPCPTVQSVVLMLDGLLEVKKLSREL